MCNEKHGWSKYDYAYTIDLNPSHVEDNVERVDARQISVAEFSEKYEKTYKPVVVTNLQRDWSATEKWAVEVCMMQG